MNVRALGCELEKSEMKKIVSEFGEKGSGKVTFQSYLQVMTQKMVCEPSRSQSEIPLDKLYDAGSHRRLGQSGSLQGRNSSVSGVSCELCERSTLG